MTDFAQIAVVGAGPAGARAAELLARRGEDVVLLDPRVPWEKPCGGGVTSSALDDVPDLAGIRPLARPIRRMSAELGPECGFSVELDRPIWMISREMLGGWQLDRACRAGARHVAAKVRSIDRTRAGWLLETDAGAVGCSFLVGADGAASLVRRSAAPTFSVELAPTRVAYPRVLDTDPDTTVLRFYRDVAGYLWDFPRPRRRSVGIAVPDGTLRRPSLDREIDGYRASMEGTGSREVPRAGAVIGTAQLGHGDFSAVGDATYALLGDAAGFADPLTGEGIQNALRSATFLADAWVSGRIETYPAMARRAFSREFAVSRALRRHVFETRLGPGWIGAACTSDLPYAGIAAFLNGLNEHNLGVGSLLRRVVTTWVRVRRRPEMAARAPRGGVRVAPSRGVKERDPALGGR